MPGEAYGEVIQLIWPDGNDDGEIYVRGHVSAGTARETVRLNSDELESLAMDWMPSESIPHPEAVYDACLYLTRRARVDHGYARWSREAIGDREDLNGVLRYYSAPGPGGRFPVTRLTLWPRPTCQLAVDPGTGIYRCMQCRRRFRGPVKPYVMGAPADCPQLVGDERTRFVEVYEELEPGEVQA